MAYIRKKREECEIKIILKYLVQLKSVRKFPTEVKQKGLNTMERLPALIQARRWNYRPDLISSFM